MNIGIFGGSFNPIHKGHMNIARDAISVLGLDKLIFVPAFKSPFKKFKLEKPEDRVNMIHVNLEDKMEISKFEINRKGTSYSIDTVNYFKNKYKDANLFLIIGSDQLAKLNKWKSINKISSITKIVVYRRNNKFSKINIKRYNCQLLNNDLYYESSTSLRSGEFQNVSKETASYIGKHHLYIKDILKGMLMPHKSKNAMMRYKHCIAAGNAAAEFAKQTGFDPKRAWAAGAFHDVTKLWPVEKHHEFLKRHKQEIVDDYELHSRTGALWLDKVYKIDDPEIVRAVKVHTSLSDKLYPLDKIVYAADKLAVGRKHKGVQEERAMIRKDFDKGFTNLVKQTYSALLKIHGSIRDKDIKTFERIINDGDNSSR